MYSPRISEDMVQQIYYIAKTKKIPMTRLVDGILRTTLLDDEYRREILNGNFKASGEKEGDNETFNTFK